ncbi:hypothetical protein COOONC_15986 [Cooperia oncophora]
MYVRNSDHSLVYIIRHTSLCNESGPVEYYRLVRYEAGTARQQRLVISTASENNPDGIRVLEMPEDSTGEGFTLSKNLLSLRRLRRTQYSRRGISVDDMHGATRYSLKLATVVVTDERDRGLPAGQFLTIYA